MKKVMCAVSFTLILAALLTACAKRSGVKSDEDINRMVLAQFEELTQIPRPSHHEEQIGAYMMEWASKHGLKAEQSGLGNVIIDVPATKGMEKKPKVVLQGHIDMVFAVKDGSEADPLTTKIGFVNDGTFVRTDGNTSLGADDGIGDSLALCIADGQMPHGPLRIIFTTDEEDGMSGILSLDPEYVRDAGYLINLDSETEGHVTVSSASGTEVRIEGSWEKQEPSKTMTVELKLSGLSGGHSGLEIHRGRLNGAIGLGHILKALADGGMDFETASFESGTARNAIPSKAAAKINIDPADLDRVRTLCNECADSLKTRYADTDPDLMLSITETGGPGPVMPSEEAEKLITFLTEYPDGVNTWSADIDGLVESSSNLGIVTADADGIFANALIRSSSPDRQTELIDIERHCCEDLGYKCTCKDSSMAWPYDPENRLLDIAKKAYVRLFDREISVDAVHAGLECGCFAAYNPELNIISIGPTITGAHSVDEQLEIASVAKVWKLLEAILAEV